MLTIAGTTFTSRLFTGTGKFSHPDIMKDALVASQTRLVTLALKRLSKGDVPDPTLNVLRSLPVTLLPNTSGAATAEGYSAGRQLRRVRSRCG